MKSTQHSNLESKEALDNIRILCQESMTSTREVERLHEREHDNTKTINIQARQIQDLQNELSQAHNQMNDQARDRQELVKKLDSLEAVAINEKAANAKINELVEQTKYLHMQLEEKDLSITKSSEDLEAAQEELRAQARQLADRGEEIENDRLVHKNILELQASQHQQEISLVITKETEKFRDEYQAMEAQLQEANIARVKLEQELEISQQEVEILKRADIEEGLRLIRDETITAVDLISQLTTGLGESDQARDGLQRRLQEWSCSRDEINQMQHTLGQLAMDQPHTIEMGNQLKELLGIQKKLSGTLQHHRGQLASLEVAVTTSQGPQNGEAALLKPGNDVGIGGNTEIDTSRSRAELQSNTRKVIVKSPAAEDDLQAPMSVEQERSARRHLMPSRGIMKIITRSASRGLETGKDTLDIESQSMAVPQPSLKRKIARRGSKTTLTTHSMYNRPVAGTVLETSKEQVQKGLASPPEHSNGTVGGHVASDLEGSDRFIHLASDPFQDDEYEGHFLKRQRTSAFDKQQGPEQNATQRTRPSRSMSEFFPAETN